MYLDNFILSMYLLFYVVLLWRAWYQNIFQQDDVYSISESEVDNFLKLESVGYTNCWLPPDPIINSRINGVISYVDMQCGLYLQNKDGENDNLLDQVTSELNSIFLNSSPEPINVKWSVGQMVIARYHVDNMWYRGTIIKKKNNGEYLVQFLDYGNIEICCHDNLRSTLYMTDIPQLLVKAYFSTISPMSTDGKWPINTLDYIHAMIVDKPCTVVIDLEMSKSNNYAISYLKLEEYSNFCQHLVSCGYAYFNHIDMSNINLSLICNDVNNDNHSECSKIEDTDSESIQQYENCKDDELIDEIDSNYKFINNDYEVINDDYKISDDIQKVENNLQDYYTEVQVMREGLDSNKESSKQNVNEVDNESKFMKFSLNLNSNEVIEGILSSVTSPTQMILLIVKIGGVNITLSKDEMQKAMFNECDILPALEKITPGTAVAVSYNFLWRRGTISNDCNFVFLVDLGISIKLIKNNLKLLPKKFLSLPMFSINCQLVNVTKNNNADDKDVIEELSRLLKGINLKIVVSNELNDTFGVELYNEKGEIAYQPLIDYNLLVPQQCI